MSAQQQQQHASAASVSPKGALASTQHRVHTHPPHCHTSADAHIPYAQVISEQRSPVNAARDTEAGKQQLLSNAPKLYTEESGVEWKGKSMTQMGDSKSASAIGYNAQGQPVGVAYLHERMSPGSYSRVEQSSTFTTSNSVSSPHDSTHAKCKDEGARPRPLDRGAKRLASPKFSPYPKVEFAAAMPTAPFGQKPVPHHDPHTATNTHEDHHNHAHTRSPK